MNTISDNNIIGYLCFALEEAELEIEQCEECISCMQDSIAEKHRLILWNRGVIDNAENTLAQIEEPEDFDAVEDEEDSTVKFDSESDAFTSIISMLDDKSTHYVKLQRSTKDGAEYRVDPVMYEEDPEEHNITISVSGD